MKYLNNNIYLDEDGDKILPNGNKVIKLRVCAYCHDQYSSGCICEYDKVPTELVEFEICKCCGNIIDEYKNE